jgi:glutamate-1-semialdehyde 2,1-aminomutase
VEAKTMPSTERSRVMFDESRRYLVNGVGSDERARVEPHPIFMTHGRGSRIFDVDGNEYIDWQMGYGALILGHCPPSVIEAVKTQLDKGSMFGTPHELEIRVSRRLTELIPSMEVVRYAQTGTEAVAHALRTARAWTGRTKFIKFEGHYHGWFDSFNVSHMPASEEMLGPYAEPTPVLASVGQSDAGFRDMIVIPWNDSAALEDAIAKHGDELAAVLGEPMMCNASCILPRPGYLELMRRLTQEHGIVLIFDEVHTGFRVGLHGAQAHFGVFPDITVLAKAMGGGYPIGALGGSREVMEGAVAKGMRHTGTYNSNPLVLAAVEATLEALSADDGAVYRRIASLATRLRHGVREIYLRAGLPARDQGVETVFSVMLSPRELTNVRDLFHCDNKTVMQVRRLLRDRGIFTRPNPRDVWYVSAAHTNEDVDRTLEAFAEAVQHVSPVNATV